MPYEEESVVAEWMDRLKDLNVSTKKMFGCYCLYCDGQAVGWIHDSVLSLREVGLTFLPMEQIDAMSDWKDAQLNTAKEILAYELTKLVHGDEEADKAQAAAKALFAQGGISENMPTSEFTAEEIGEGIAILDQGEVLAMTMGSRLTAALFRPS